MPLFRLLLPLFLVTLSTFAQISINPQNVPPGSVNVPYSATLTASGGLGNYGFTFVSGQLPNGVSMNNAGKFSGTPTVAGNFSFTVRVTDGSSTADFPQVLNITSSTGVQITTQSLPDGQVSQQYSTTLSAAGGAGSYSWGLVSGSGNLPPGLTFTSGGVILGSPSQAGTFNFVFRVTDASGGTAQGNLSLRVNSNQLSILTTSLPAGSVGAGYNQTITAAGGVTPYAFGLSGNLPSGLTLSSGGIISGIPTAGGTTNFTITVADGANNVSSRPLSISIGIAQLAINQQALPSAQLGQAYSANVTATNGTPPYTFSIASGTLPVGISFSSSGVFSGIPQASGSFPFTVRVTDNTNATATSQFTIAVNSNSLSITTVSLPNGVLSQSYNSSITASGGQQPYIFQIIGGNLPNGISINTNGTLSGTPLAAGSSAFTVRVTDSTFSISQASLSILVNSNGLVFVSTALPNGQTGQSYTSSLTVSGGTTPYTFTVQSGSLPPGLVLGAGGGITGVPDTAGTYQTTYRVQDANGISTLASIPITIATGNLVSITTAQLPTARLNQSYSASFQATGGTAPYSWFVSGGNLPSGLFLSPSGVLSGTPNQSGTFNFTIRATDNLGNQAQASYTINVNNSNITLSNTTLNPAVLNQGYTATLSAFGGTAPYTYSVTGGALPAGIAVATNGVVSGTPTASGNYSFIVRVQDSVLANPAASFTVLLTVSSSSLSVSTSALPTGITGVSYSALITATGGTGPYLFDITGGGLPSGLFMTQAGGISGAPSQPGTFSFTVRATDSVGATASATQTIVVVTSGTLTITTTSLPALTINQNYNVALTAIGGTFPYSYSLSSGLLPPGLTLSPSGSITGIATTPGNFGFVVRLQDNGGASTQASLSIVVSANGLYVSTTTLPNPQLGTFYSATLSAAGGTLPYTWSVISGTLPNGITLSQNGMISGVASVGGNYPVTFRVSDTTNATAQAAFTILVGSNFLAFTTTSIPTAFIGQQFSFQLLATGGAIPYQFSVASGVLPTGIQLTQNGLLYGIPTTSSITSIVFRVTDATAASATFSTNVVVGQSSLLITTTSLPNAIAGQLYSQTIQASGGTTPYTFSLTSGTLPSGIAFSGTGSLLGTTNQIGVFNLTFRVQDSASASSVTNLSLTVTAGSFQITTTSLPAARVNQSYSQTLQTSGGTQPIRFDLLNTINVGFPPPGISVSQTGVISGTPQSTGSYTFSVRATDAQNLTTQATYTIVVNAGGPTITTTSLPPGITSQAYSQAILVTGGTTPYVFSLLTGFLPPGLLINPNSGTLAGTPTTAGSYTFTVRISDSASQTADATYTVSITNDATQISINALAPPPGILFFPYSFTLSATGGREPYTWSLPVGPIPNGLRLDPGGNLNGLLLAPGTYRFTVRVSETNNSTADATITITVAGPTGLAQGTVGNSYSAQAPVPSLGRPPFTYALNGNALGNLPPGVSLNSAGSLSGIPTTSGEFTFGLIATDAIGFRSNLALTIGVIGGNFTVTTPGLPGGSAGAAYSQTLTAAGGRAPYNWVVSSGSLPNGLNLNPLNGQITGTPTIQGTNFFTVRVGDSNSSSAMAYFGISVGAPGSPVINAITSAASYGATGIAPGEILTIFGGTLGPQTLTSFSLVNNTVPTLLAGTRVLFDGVAAPIIYTQASQLSVIAPFGLSTKKSVRVVVEYLGFQSTPFLLPVLASKPGIFTVDSSGQGPGAILNENGSVNTSSNRAAKESVVVLYTTGGGSMTPAGQDGQVSSGISSLNLQTLATINSQPTTVQYAGNAPGLVQGVIQINVKLPPLTKSGANDIVMQIGPNSTTSTVTVWVE